MKTLLACSAAAAFLPLSVNAATMFFFDQGAFNAEIAGEPTTTEGFDTAFPDGTPVNAAVFDSGITIDPVSPSADNNTFNGYVRLSTDNANAETPQSPFTDTITVNLPNPTTFVSLEFGLNDGRGIGNNSSTEITVGSDSFDFSTVPGVNRGTGDFEGFFGAISDTAFSSFTFSGLDLGTRRDDDFSIDNLTFAADPVTAAIPLPAGLPLLAGGLFAFGAIRIRRKAG